MFLGKLSGMQTGMFFRSAPSLVTVTVTLCSCAASGAANAMASPVAMAIDRLMASISKEEMTRTSAPPASTILCGRCRSVKRLVVTNLNHPKISQIPQIDKHTCVVLESVKSVASVDASLVEGLRMLPWVERPTLHLDLALPPEQRYAPVPAEAVRAGRTLLAAIMREIPAPAKLLADLVRLRTANRFHAEAVGLARHVGADWREIVLANVSY